MFRLVHDPIPKTREAAQAIAQTHRMFGGTAAQFEGLSETEAHRIKAECEENLNRAIIGELERIGVRHAPAVYLSLVQELARGIVFTSDNALFARATGRAVVDLLNAEIADAINDRFGT